MFTKSSLGCIFYISYILFKSSHYFQIATGIGVTPFSSILQSVMFKYKVATRTCPQCSFKWVEDLSQWVQSLQKVDFFWINRDQKSFEWFLNLLIGMYDKCILVQELKNYYSITFKYTFFANFRLIIYFRNFITKFTPKIQNGFFAFLGEICQNYILCSQNLFIFLLKDKLLSIDKYFRISIPTLMACFCKREHLTTVIVYAQCWAKNEKDLWS